MLIGLKKNQKVDVYDDMQTKEFFNEEYETYLFPIGTEATTFTCVEPCEALRDFKKATLSYRVALFDSHDIRSTYERFTYGKPSYVEIDNVNEFLKFLHSFVELNAFNTMFQLNDRMDTSIFVLSNFKMTVKYGNTKETLKMKPKHRKYNSDPLEPYEGNLYLIPTVMFAIDDFLRIGNTHHKKQLFTYPDHKIFINEKLTKWDKKNSFSGQSLISEALINSNALTFVNDDIDKILNNLKLTDKKFENRRAISGCVRLCQYVMMCDEDDLPLDHPLSINAIHELNYQWFDIYDILTYPLYTPADYVEAACTAYYMLRTSKFLLDLTGNENEYKSILEINFTVWDNGSGRGFHDDTDYSIRIFESDLMENHPKDEILKQMVVNVCRYLRDIDVL